SGGYAAGQDGGIAAGRRGIQCHPRHLGQTAGNAGENTAMENFGFRLDHDTAPLQSGCRISLLRARGGIDLDQLIGRHDPDFA
ncbi:MAG: hypothetical protein WCA56_19835, partial [Xanthobacteraceae bacterium]